MGLVSSILIGFRPILSGLINCFYQNKPNFPSNRFRASQDINCLRETAQLIGRINWLNANPTRGNIDITEQSKLPRFVAFRPILIEPNNRLAPSGSI